MVIDWPDDAARAILRRCREHVGPGVSVLVAEQMLPEQGLDCFASLLDVHLMLMGPGGLRTPREILDLAGACGFSAAEVRINPTGVTLVHLLSD